MLTGLGNADGNRANHEIGICLPQFTLNLTSTCLLTVKPKYAGSAYMSLLIAGRDSNGRPNVPLASDTAMAISDAVNNKLGYYYLDPVKCPQSYTMRIKGAQLLSHGARAVPPRGADAPSAGGSCGRAMSVGAAYPPPLPSNPATPA